MNNLCLMLSLCVLLTAVAGAAEPVELVNPSFEHVAEDTGLPQGWTSWTTPGTAAYTLAAARTGVACARVTDDSPTASQGLRCSPAPITPGQTYEGSVWVRITDLKAGGFALYLEYWSGAERLQNTSVSTDKQGDWVPLKIKAPAPAGAQTATLLIYGASATVGEAYFDDAALALVP